MTDKLLVHVDQPQPGVPIEIGRVGVGELEAVELGEIIGDRRARQRRAESEEGAHPPVRSAANTAQGGRLNQVLYPADLGADRLAIVVDFLVAGETEGGV